MNDLPSALCAQLSTLLGTRFSLASAVRDQHAGGGMHLRAQPPQAVAMVENLEEIIAIVHACAEHKVPIIPYGVAHRSSVMWARPSAASRSISPV